MKKTILSVVHDSAKNLYKLGLVKKQTMQELEALCIPPVKEIVPSEIKHID